MRKFNLIDDSFNHHTSVGLKDYSVAGRESTNIIWDRSLSDQNLITFYSNEKVLDIEKNLTPKEKSYGLLFESRAIITGTYERIESDLNKFEKFFTHNSNFLKKYNNCYWIPGGGIWIGGKYGGGEIRIHDKNKLCSIVSSNKRMCDLHNFRLDIVNYLSKNYSPKVTIFGVNGWKPIWESLNDYMFSIVVENYQDELYFTEKILNCFATGTIPIYLGAKNIGEKFNMEGILQFNNINELKVIMSNLNENVYHERFEAIKDNFERCQNYKIIEDFIYNNYL
jgi:hypothetical protein